MGLNSTSAISSMKSLVGVLLEDGPASGESDGLNLGDNLNTALSVGEVQEPFSMLSLNHPGSESESEFGSSTEVSFPLPLLDRFHYVSIRSFDRGRLSMWWKYRVRR